VISEHAELQDTFRAFFSREASPDRVRAAEQADPPGFDADLWSRARRLGIPDMAVDGATPADLAVVAEQHGRVLAPIPLVETFVARRLLDRVPEEQRPQVDDDSLVTLALRPAVGGLASLVPAGSIARAVVAVDDE
jgi:alkylation response protein AidB-like acyl-CoA dehydrogenase